MTIYCDLDGTLTRRQDTPKPWPVWQENVDALKKLIEEGHNVIIWSCRGRGAAWVFAAKHRLAATCLRKPDVCFDDEPSLHDNPHVMKPVPPIEIAGWVTQNLRKGD